MPHPKIINNVKVKYQVNIKKFFELLAILMFVTLSTTSSGIEGRIVIGIIAILSVIAAVINPIYMRED